MDWFYSHNGERQGPVDIDTLKKLAREGKLLQADLVWNKSMGEKWSPVSEVPILADPMKAKEDPRANAEFKARLADQTKALKRKKAADNARIIASLAVIVLLVAGAIIWVRGKPRRELGISGSAPLGMLDKFGAKLKSEEFQFQEKSVSSCKYVARQGVKIIEYNKPQAERGAHVTSHGSITLLADENGRIHGVMAKFPSPGQHGAYIIDRSLTSNFMDHLWDLLGGMDRDNRGYDAGAALPSDSNEIYGMVNMPRSSWASVETEQARGIWILYSPDLLRTMVYITVK